MLHFASIVRQRSNIIIPSVATNIIIGIDNSISSSFSIVIVIDIYIDDSFCPALGNFVCFFGK